MGLTVNKEPHQDKKVTMGKADEPVADYYPPGATEPIVRPAHIPAPEAPAVDENEPEGQDRPDAKAEKPATKKK